MAPTASKGHRANGLLRTHSRNTSGGSSKVGLNLHFTAAKESAPAAKNGGKKGAQHHTNEPQRTSSPYRRSTSAVRANAREPPPKLQNKPKSGFTLAASEPDEDSEGDWVSSGAATPADQEESDVDETSTPVDQSKPTLPTAGDFETKPPTIGRTSTARPNEPLARTSTARPDTLVKQPKPPKVVAESPPIMTDLPPPVRLSQLQQRQLPQVARQPQTPLPPRQPRKAVEPTPSVVVSPQRQSSERYHRRAESEVHQPRPVEPERRKQAVTRPPSLHTAQLSAAPSIKSASSSRTDLTTLRPHPLIRGQSYGQSVAHHGAARLTPLAAVTSEMVSSPPGGSLSTSPSSIGTTSAPNTPDPGFNRRLSTASATTLPAPSHHDRTRTLSTMSTSSSHLKPHHTPSFAALTSLAHPTREPAPQMVTYFPTPNPHINLELIHPLLPPPYLAAHMTVLETRNPMRESWERVMRAKRRVR